MTRKNFLKYLRTGIVNKEMKSKYACNFRFFQNNIDEFLSKYPIYFAYLPTRIMNNCILLPIEAESQDTVLRIFQRLMIYEGFTNSKGQVKEGTGVVELLNLTATSTDFTENDIIDRYKKMIDCFINYLQKNSSIK